MTTRQLALLLILGIIGYSLLAYLFPRYDIAPSWQYRFDREQTVAKATKLAEKFGVDVSAWDYAARAIQDGNEYRYLSHQAIDQVASNWLSPIKSQIIFRNHRINQSLLFTFTANGQLVKFSRAGYKSSNPDKELSLAQNVIDDLSGDLLGEHKSTFIFNNTAKPDKGKTQYLWKYTSTNDQELQLNAEMVLNGDTLVELKVDAVLPPAYRDDISGRDVTAIALFGSLEFILNTLCIIGAVIYYLLSLKRKQVDHLSTLIFFSLSFSILLFSNSIGSLLDSLKGQGLNVRGVNNPTVLMILPYVVFLLLNLVFALAPTVLWSSSEVFTAKYHKGRLASFAAMIRGRIFNQKVITQITAGLLLGGLVAAIPYVFGYVLDFPQRVAGLANNYGLFASQFPSLAAVGKSVEGLRSYDLMLLFAFLWTVLRSLMQSKWLARGLFVVFGLALLIDINPPQNSGSLVQLLIAAATLAIFVFIHRYFDFLGLFATSFASTLSVVALGMLVQPSTVLQSAGIRGLSLLGGITFLLLILTRFAPEAQVEPRELLNQTEDKAERERLKAEFEVARRAQEKLLPDAPPEIPGFSIAALCRPARECGGDLYDFIPLSDGKIGIVVADVSGKGVPAALYMTLTKGLLLSIAETNNDPGQILREVNKHLYDVCKRKVFVTLVLGVIDPVSRTLTFSRAGHNPPVLRRMSEQTTELLMPAGIGLGMNSGKSFDRVLAVEQIQLNSNDLLIFYSDGITEAMNKDNEEFGEERLMKLAAFTDGMSAEESLSAVIANVSNFLGPVHPQDDQTLVMIRVS